MNHRASHHHPVRSLIAARLREFLREPEAIFWVYVFPLFMVVALGVAFRNRPVEAFRVAVVQGRDAESVRAALAASPRFRAAAGDEQECELRLRTGRADLLIAVSGESGKGGQAPFAGTALGVLRTKGACPPFPPSNTASIRPAPKASWPAARPTISCNARRAVKT